MNLRKLKQRSSCSHRIGRQSLVCAIHMFIILWPMQEENSEVPTKIESRLTFEHHLEHKK